jgi:hypothetical protein
MERMEFVCLQNDNFGVRRGVDLYGITDFAQKIVGVTGL